ncbi:MAG: amidohydrolase [Planctomycetota bacterium]|nr:MAG: amidohydrolase [Planctomycetota bacterium]
MSSDSNSSSVHNTSSRRQFLSAVTTSAVAVVASPYLAAQALNQSADILIVDTHQHLWDLTQVQPPWLAGAPKILSQSYGLAEYAKATEGLNVVQAVYMEVDVSPEDHVKEADTLINICRTAKSPTVAAVISGRPGEASFAPYIRSYSKEKEIKGVRQVLHAESAKKGLCLEPQFVKSIQLLGELGLSFDLCMRPSELSDGLALAKKCPGTRFIVDHCGNASPNAFLPESARKDKASHDPQQWRDDIKALAHQDNVICKISGVIASAPAGIPFAESLAPIVNHCLDSFGPDKVIFGGDWPVCLLGGSYKDWVMALRQIIADRPVADQKKLLHENAKKFYGLPS